ARVAGQRTLDRRVGRQATRHAVEDSGSEIAVGQGLGGNGTDAGADEGAGGADGEGLGRDGHGERAGRGIVTDDGPGHGEVSNGTGESWNCERSEDPMSLA